MSVPPQAPTLARGQGAVRGSCLGWPGAARTMPWMGMGQGGSAALPRAARPTPGSCLKNALSLWLVHPTGPGAHGCCREPAPPLQGASRADETLAGTYWHCIREREVFWQGLGLLPRTSHKTYIIKKTLFNKVLVGRRGRRLLCPFSFTSPRAPSAGSLKHPTLRWELTHPLSPAPSSWPLSRARPWGGDRGQAEAATVTPGQRRAEVSMCRSSTFPSCDPACCEGRAGPQHPPSPCQQRLPLVSTITGAKGTNSRGQSPAVHLMALFKAGEGWAIIVCGYVLCSWQSVTADASVGPHPSQRASGTSTPCSAGSSPVSFKAPSCCFPGPASPASVLVPGSLPWHA